MTAPVLWPSLQRLWNSRGSGGVLFRGTLSTFLVSSIALGVAIPVQILLTRLLGDEIWGRYSYALTWVNFLALVGALGCETVTIRFVAAYRGAGDFSRMIGIVKWGLRVPAVASLGISLSMVAILFGVPRLHDQAAWAPLLLGALLLPAVVMLKLTAAVLKGLRRILFGIVAQGIVRPVLIGFLMVVVWLAMGRTTPGAGAVMAINVVVTVGVAAASVWIVRREVGRLTPSMTPIEDRTVWRRTAGPHFMISMSQTLLLYCDAIMVGLLISTRNAGIYNIVIQLTQLIAFGGTAVSTVVAPLIAERHGEGRIDESRRIVRLASLGMAAYAVAVGGLLVILRHPVLNLFGSAFIEGSDTLIVMVVGQLVVAVLGPLGFYMTMTGHERIASWYVAASAVFNVLLNALLIPRYGMMGAATATAIAVTTRAILLARWYLMNGRIGELDRMASFGTAVEERK